MYLPQTIAEVKKKADGDSDSSGDVAESRAMAQAVEESLLETGPPHPRAAHADASRREEEDATAAGSPGTTPNLLHGSRSA